MSERAEVLPCTGCNGHCRLNAHGAYQPVCTDCGGLGHLVCRHCDDIAIISAVGRDSAGFPCCAECLALDEEPSGVHVLEESALGDVMRAVLTVRWACVCGGTATTEDVDLGGGVVVRTHDVQCGCSRQMQRVAS